MLDMGFLPSVRRILQQVPAERQTLLFSATFPDEIETLAKKSMRRPERVTLGLSRPVHTVRHALYPVQQQNKLSLLLALLQRTETGSVLVFTRTRHRAQRVARQIGQSGYRVTSLHSDRTQSQRQAALQGFRRGEFQIMVATDIAARGLDVESISHVINFDMPDTADAYIHRIGRTGRAERSGEAYTMTTPEDADMVKTLEKIMGKTLPQQILQDFDYHQAAQEPRSAEQRPQMRSSLRQHTAVSQRPAGQRPQVRSNHRKQAEVEQRHGQRRPQASGNPGRQTEPEASSPVAARWGRTLRSRRRTM